MTRASAGERRRQDWTIGRTACADRGGAVGRLVRALELCSGASGRRCDHDSVRDGLHRLAYVERDVFKFLSYEASFQSRCALTKKRGKG